TKDVILPTGGGYDGKSPVLATAGTLVIFHFAALHKRKDLWGEDADEFRPERWQDEKASWNFLPFGGGPRNCIGRKYPHATQHQIRDGTVADRWPEQFALTEASYTAVRLLQEFTGIESRDSQPWTERLGATVFSANGAKVSMMK
ncbi:MAG: hypothetical protein Q9192_008315, partial [Flavoplaca navasiana]